MANLHIHHWCLSSVWDSSQAIQLCGGLTEHSGHDKHLAWISFISEVVLLCGCVERGVRLGSESLYGIGGVGGHVSGKSKLRDGRD